MSDRKQPGRPGETRTELVARLGKDAPILAWAEALTEERRRNEGAPLALPEPPPPSKRFDDAHQRYFLELLAATDSLKHSLSCTGFTQGALTTARENSPEFDRAVRLVQALVKAYRRARTLHTLQERAYNGVNRVPKFDKDGQPLQDPVTGEYVYTAQYSDALLMKLMDMDIPESRPQQGPLVEVNAQTGVIRVPERAATEEEFDEQAQNLRAPQFEDAEVEVKPRKDVTSEDSGTGDASKAKDGPD